MSNLPDEQDVLTTPSVLECPICNEQYGIDYEKTPRVLKCGHTYCTKCLAKLITIHPGKKYGVKCAFCNALHELSRLDPTVIPINHAVLEIIKVNDSAKVKEEKAKDVPKCEFKGSTCIGTANWVCFDCNPTTNTMFCDACIKAEHERGFEPVARHRRMLMAQVNNPHTASCTYHPRNTATMFSVKLQVFACGECNSRPAFSEQKHLFEPIVDSVQRLRAQAQRMVKYSQDILAKLNVSLANISANNAELGPSVQQTKSQIQEKFAEIVEIIQEREQTLMKHVEGEYSERRQGMEDQLSKIKVAFNEISAAQGSLNSALGKRDIDFLLHYLPAYQAMEKVLNEEDRSLQRTVSYKDIPFYIPQSIMADLRKLGAVGGGCAPYDIEVDVSSDYSNLLQLQWQIPHYANEVQCYEIEYENLPNTSETGLKGSRVQSDTYYNVEPQSVIIPGNVLATYIHGLCPGYKYRFRIRSQNVAGWGMWSKSVVATCDPFPIWIKGTKRIYKICIPKDGYYRLTAKGAKGADGKVHYGGRGAIVSGTFALKAGDVLIILVGTMSTMSVCNTGGGGGSFIALNEISQKNLLIAAGGGGGTRGLEERDEDGRDANLETWGLDGVGKEHGKGGVGGGPGEDANSDGFSGPCWGYGGAGFVQNSSSARSFFEGGTGGQYGGFGGGGAVGLYGGGGGGGYSGGGGGRGGGGGGSYIREDASDVKKILGNESHGEVEIKVVPPPQETLDTFANTNAVLPSPEEVTMQTSSESYVSQQSIPPASLRQPSAIPPMMGSDLPPQSYPYTSQYSKSSTSSNSSGTSSVWGAASLLQSLTDYPPVPDTIMEVPLSIVPSDPQQDDREVTLTAIDEAVQVLDTSYPLGNSNNTLLQYQPELLHSTQDAITILPPAESGGMAGPSLPPQPVATQTGSSNASSEISPPQIINTHPNSNANTGTT